MNTEGTNGLFKDSLKYQPTYFPPGMAIEVLANADQPYLPWTFRLPYQSHKKVQEPMVYPNGILRLTKVEFGIPRSNFDSSFVNAFRGETEIFFRSNEHYHLFMEFDHEKQGKCQNFATLNLTIRY